MRTEQVIKTDPKDNIIECAVVGNATHIITGDKRHLLPLKSYQCIMIINAADFLTLVGNIAVPLIVRYSRKFKKPGF